MVAKKGQVSSIAPAILALVFAGIVLVFGIVMAQSLTDTRTGTQTYSIVNESLTLTGTGISSAHSHTNDCGYGTWAVTQVMNKTTNVTLAETTNYIVNANGTITNVTQLTNPILVTYTYTGGGEACEVGNLTVVGLGSFADFWEIIVLAIVITIVIGLLLVIFGGKQKR